MKTLLSLFVVTLVINSYAFGQITMGPEVGGNMCTYFAQSYKTDIFLGLRAGFTANFGITNHWSLQPGIYYVQNQLNPRSIGGTIPSLKINTIELPVSMVYSFGQDKIALPFIGAGFFAAYNAGGRTIIPGGDGPQLMPDINRQLSVGSSLGNDIRAFDLGIAATAGIKLVNRLFVRLSMQKGLVNLQPISYPGNYMRSFAGSISMGYLFYYSSATRKVKEEK